MQTALHMLYSDCAIISHALYMSKTTKIVLVAGAFLALSYWMGEDFKVFAFGCLYGAGALYIWNYNKLVTNKGRDYFTRK